MPYIYPSNIELRSIEPVLQARSRASRLGLQIMPVRGTRAAKVRWTQQDNYRGLQQLRGLDGEPTRVKRVGEKTFEYEPGVYGEFLDITETELTTRSQGVDINTVNVDVSDMMVQLDNQLIQREDDRLEASAWAVLTTGTISIKIAGPNGTQTGWTDTFTIQTFTATVPWATFATATPFKDFQSVQLMGLAAGKGVDLGAGAVAYMNSVTSSNLLNNQNANDLAGRRVEGGSTVNTLVDVNRYLLGRNLPQIQVYDQGYLDDAGTFQKFIPDNVVSVVGRRPNGERIMEYLQTICIPNNSQPGSYMFTVDRANAVNAEKRVPPNIERHRGHNGGPVIYIPSAIVKMNV
jgi:hypothetical protein